MHGDAIVKINEKGKLVTEESWELEKCAWEIYSTIFALVSL